MRYVVRRLLLVIPLALGVATLVFVLMEAAPGDPVDLLLGDAVVPAEVRERISHAYGLDRSAPDRYLSWMRALFVEGDLGWSHARSRPVAEVLGHALPPTLALAGAALVIHLVAGVGLGLVAAARAGSWLDRLLSWLAHAAYALPTFWLGLMGILLFSSVLRWLPASSMHSVDAAGLPPLQRAVDMLWHLTLPALVLGLGSTAAMLRFVRAGTIENLDRTYVRAARARGCGRMRVLLRHALRNALLPVINLMGMSLPLLVSGSLAIETVFAWPGMGRLAYDAIRAHDFAVVAAATLLATSLVVVGNLAADLLMAAADPRIRLRGSR